MKLAALATVFLASLLSTVAAEQSDYVAFDEVVALTERSLDEGSLQARADAFTGVSARCPRRAPKHCPHSNFCCRRRDGGCCPTEGICCIGNANCC